MFASGLESSALACLTTLKDFLLHLLTCGLDYTVVVCLVVSRPKTPRRFNHSVGGKRVTRNDTKQTSKNI